MEANALSTLISNLGFPIAMCCMLGYIMYKEMSTHNEETDRLSAVIADNTKAIEKLQTMVNTMVEYFVKGSEKNDD